MKITIDCLDDAYFHFADKTESFWCKYVFAENEVFYIHKMPSGEIDFYCPATKKIIMATQEMFEKEFGIVGHPLHIWIITDMISKRIKDLSSVVVSSEFLRYVNLGKFIIDAWTFKSNPLESACPNEDLFNNLIKLIWDFFDDPKPDWYVMTKKEDAIQSEIDATKKLLDSNKKK